MRRNPGSTVRIPDRPGVGDSRVRNQKSCRKIQREPKTDNPMEDFGQ
ncbi:hypothetical protein FRUB_05005 [Fimbriiglobus ruber]|uniref:Uncharacterized protein n=1 Tax=Fimbriiglobus ruber TaxID=1908690 RepID=A0A225DJI6_9BACT|nr:hypothetical protein FRUB_05005 [Fimbriiglobus ruber]